jgi:hypothetical protein
MCTITKVLLPIAFWTNSPSPLLSTFGLPPLFPSASLPFSHSPPSSMAKLTIWPCPLPLHSFPIFPKIVCASSILRPSPFPSFICCWGPLLLLLGMGRVRLTVETVALALWGAHSPISPFAHQFPSSTFPPCLSRLISSLGPKECC